MSRKSIAALLASLLALPGTASARPAPAYTLAKTIPIGAPDRWDYIVFDAATKRVYVAHGERVTVLEARSGAIAGQVEGMPGGTHGIAISTATGRGYTDDGGKPEVVAFDLKTLKVTNRIPAGDDADGIVRDPKTAHIFTVDGDPGLVTVVDPRTNTVVATIDAGEKLEYAAADDAGHVFAAGEANSDLVKIDARTNTVVARWATPDCKSPHGLALDKVGRRLFMSCINSRMMVVDADSGRIVATLPIGLGSDAVAWDAKRRRAFSSNGRDGTISVYQQTTPDRYRAMTPIATQVSGRTMTLDPATGRLYVVVADTDPNPTPGGRPKTRPGTVRVLMYDPVG